MLPTDPKTVAWLDSNFHPVFGFPNVARFSWAPVKNALLKKGVAFKWCVADHVDFYLIRAFFLTSLAYTLRQVRRTRRHPKVLFRRRRRLGPGQKCIVERPQPRLGRRILGRSWHAPIRFTSRFLLLCCHFISRSPARRREESNLKETQKERGLRFAYNKETVFERVGEQK